MLKAETRKSSRKGQEALMRELVGILPRLRRFARGLAKDPAVADDLVQEACERALTRLDQVREGTRFDSWMYRIVHTRWIGWLRKGKVRSDHLSLVKSQAREGDAHSAGSVGADRALEVKRALQALPDDQRSAVLLVCIEGHSYAEAAAILEVPPGTVASRVARARIELGKALFDKGKGA